MQQQFDNEVMYYTFPQLQEYDDIIHAFSSREGGVSSGFYRTMNLGIRTEDNMENVLENYRIFCDTIHVDLNKVVLAPLSHGDSIRNVTAEDAGCGLLKPFTYENVDGLLTNVPGLVLTATFADCVPVYFYDPVKKVVGIAHSGWRGTVKEIAGKMVDRMVADYGSDVKDIVAGIGPSIGMCCFEVDEDVFYDFTDLTYLGDGWYYEKENGHYDIDLWRVIWSTLTERGVSPEHIYISGICTCCNRNVLFSHRATKGRRGTMAGMIALKEK